ncbi:CAP domain-containing protein [Mucilaginibacter sp. RS28]|uniref:CAP domain-containing protein n=1 Tax=Mucilaginibacter straminoryzae TaxID=2932774 RepID=A0A9X2BEK5_9SPHI|nr:CAP domain-containing protein [Mucilaginibacter straminoryzae]MCJ8211503.1 CAP domain-containing protein [Mucilaginibacter straminoryzae]
MMKRWISAGIAVLAMLFVTVLVKSQNLSDYSFGNEFLSRINRVRAVGCSCGKKFYPPAPPLVWNSDLEKAAAGHAKDMNRRDYFSHTSKDGRTIENRIINAGYNYDGFKSFAIGENIAYGQTSIAEVQDGWFESEGHCKNLMNPDFREIGVARNGLYWVQDFGGRESFSAKELELIKKGRLIYKKTISGRAD